MTYNNQFSSHATAVTHHLYIYIYIYIYIYSTTISSSLFHFDLCSLHACSPWHELRMKFAYMQWDWLDCLLLKTQCRTEIPPLPTYVAQHERNQCHSVSMGCICLRLSAHLGFHLNHVVSLSDDVSSRVGLAYICKPLSVHGCGYGLQGTQQQGWARCSW